MVAKKIMVLISVYIFIKNTLLTGSTFLFKFIFKKQKFKKLNASEIKN